MSTTVTYQNNVITTVTNQTRTLTTAGKWLTDNIILTDVTAASGGVTQDENGYIILPSTGSGGSGSGNNNNNATQHTIHLEFSDSTDTDVAVYYDNSLIGTMITAYEPSTWTYNNKTVTLAQLDNVTWYDKQSIPIGVELIDYSNVSANTAIDSSGAAISQDWYYASDYTAVDPSMTFSYRAGIWFYIGVYDSSHNVLRTIYAYNDGIADPNDSNTAYGTLSGNELTGAAYVRLTGTWYDSDHMSLIRTA